VDRLQSLPGASPDLAPESPGEAVDEQSAPLHGYISGTGNVEFADVTMELIRIDGKRALLRFRPR
jgi:hypothetical protein